MDCDFCLRLTGEMSERPWYDFSVVGSWDEFCAILALGALTPGHVMIVTRSHVDCMAQLPNDSLTNLTSAVDYWTHAISEVWGQPCFVFEHGGPSDNCLSGACVTHAHLQLLPLSVNPIRAGSQFESFGSLAVALSHARDSNYLLYAWSGQFHVMRNRYVPGQFFRREIAGVLGRPDEWDYLAFPNYDYMMEGKDRLYSYSEQSQGCYRRHIERTLRGMVLRAHISLLALGRCKIFQRLIRSVTVHQEGKDSRGGTLDGEGDAVQRWLGDVYLPSLTEQITNSLDYLHNAINWGLVVLSGTLVVVLTSIPYRDTTTLPALLIILVLCVHFFCRTARAYINVIRFSLVHRAITNHVLSINALSSEIDPVEAIRTYILQWKLPLRRVDVFRKVLFELGYGYLLVIDLALIVYVFITVGPRLATWVLAGIALALISVELTLFVKSPYMRSPVPNVDAVRDR